MPRLMRRALAATLGTLLLVGFGFAGSAAHATESATTPSTVASSTADFTFDSWHSDFTLGLDASGRSALTTVETITARFPETDQNHGILRAIPTDYQGHPTDVSIVSVTDENGEPRSYSSETTGDDGNFLNLTIAADDFVHGPHTYVITYDQTNVTLYPDNAVSEQFYWDVNGTGWAQPFAEVTASVFVAPELVDQLTEDQACYRGPEGATQACDAISGAADGSGWRVDAGATSLAPYENLTVVVDFAPGTFVPRDDSFTANVFPTLGLVGALAAVLVVVLAGFLRAGRWKRAPGRPTIIAEYLPPKGVNLLTSGEVSGLSGTAIAAQFVSFAVRGNVRILEETDRKSHYLLEFRTTDGADEAELRVLGLLFPRLLPGERRDLKKKSAPLTTALQKELSAARKASLRTGLRAAQDTALRAWLLVAALASVALAFGASMAAVVTVVGGFWPAVTIGVAILATLATFAFVGNFRPLTRSGAELRDYLKGVKLYIGLAEADRLRVLQSPEGALRSPYRPDLDRATAAEPAQVVRLSERVLPLAVLFGQEKEWSRVLGRYYEQSGTQPDWYVGTNAFSALYFAGAVSGFAAATTASWSGTSTSSSGSGTGGGGSSGGGGGGGGGGGV
ncbi:hypothetical protein JF66_00900 [Cryobacterium sp. MLB-32]|uniref:DUF2207 family protein n=1 Tax=Cryobacterium sp. MLB-32 TaxID=1529318 RepID=UPI0004E6141A|nr:DUF2207 domain-containing protein [Cryobacterium sp. MLB-32]KFF60944.1 hypothetical protein JF66_00900 [Cryobacterium sp. MLB-32]